jgi:hypothetical protein
MTTPQTELFTQKEADSFAYEVGCETISNSVYLLMLPSVRQAFANAAGHAAIAMRDKELLAGVEFPPQTGAVTAVRTIRACEGEVAAQLRLEHYANSYAKQAVAAAVLREKQKDRTIVKLSDPYGY